MSDAMETLAAIVTLEGEIKRLRAINAELVAALEMAERAYQTGILNDREGLWRQTIEMRRAAIARAKP